jgi:nucleoside-diphosphate-sugar epimerase
MVRRCIGAKPRWDYKLICNAGIKDRPSAIQRIKKLRRPGEYIQFGYNRIPMCGEKISIHDVAELEDLLSEPTEELIHTFDRLDGDIVILGVGGKMGPTLARMARRASDAARSKRRIIGVSRFSSSTLESQLHAWGVETIRCELLDRAELSQLPEAPNVVYMAGMKFGSSENESLTWAMNSLLPGLVSEKYDKSRIVAFSTGNVYGLSPVSHGGSREGDSLNPVGEYAMSCLARERIFEHFSRTNHTKVATIRLNYAAELRYGVLHDIAVRVHLNQPVALSMGYLNVIWQADASAMSLQALGNVSEPPNILNITGPELLSVRRVAEGFGQRFHKAVSFEGTESDDALLSNAQKAFGLFGGPRVDAERLMTWIADWISRGGITLAKPTHFEDRAGRF